MTWTHGQVGVNVNKRELNQGHSLGKLMNLRGQTIEYNLHRSTGKKEVNPSSYTVTKKLEVYIKCFQVSNINSLYIFVKDIRTRNVCVYRGSQKLIRIFLCLKHFFLWIGHVYISVSIESYKNMYQIYFIKTFSLFFPWVMLYISLLFINLRK